MLLRRKPLNQTALCDESDRQEYPAEEQSQAKSTCVVNKVTIRNKDP